MPTILARLVVLYGFGAALVLLTSGLASGRSPTIWLGLGLLSICLLLVGGRARASRAIAPDVVAYMQHRPVDSAASTSSPRAS
jgi:hypothetical protein